MRLAQPFSAALVAIVCTQLAGCTGSQNATTLGGTAPSPSATPSESSAPAPASGAEAFYQELLRQHGENCAECLQPIKVQLQDSGFSGKDKPAAAQPVNVLVALDSSGSMAETVAGGEKMTVAKAAVSQFVGKLPSSANVGLLVYGHKGSSQKADQAASCAGIDTIYPIAPLDQAKFASAVNSVQPTSYTPLAAALQKSEQAMNAAARENAENVIFVVSDGLETCDGDPIAVARQLHSSKAKVIINVIGFDVDNEAQRQLQAIADAGGGKFFPARSAADLNQIFDRSRTLSELNRYRATNLQNQNRVSAVLTRASNDLTACVLQRQNREQANMMKALNSIPIGDPRSQYRDYVQRRQNERQQRITEWRERLVQDVANKRDVTIEQLEKDLQETSSGV